MNLKIFFLLISIMPASASIYSQNRKLDVSVENYSLEGVFEQIEKQSEFTFLYSVEDIEVYTNISVDIKGGSVDEVLTKCLINTSLTCDIEGKLVVVRQKEHIMTPKVDSREKKEVKGRVKDEKGEGLPGVNVVVKGTAIGTATDIDGNFTIEVDNLNQTLVFSFIGFLSKEVKIDNNTNISVVLDEDSENLSEVVVVGYGTQKKVNMTGSVISVDAKKIEDRPTENILKSLQGAIPGVTIISRPGGTSINIRGRGNLGSSSPLYIVDGIEVSSDFFSNLDPSVIENLSFLKDASSAAIYGAKAAYGVVLVTTKTGTKGKLQVVYNGSAGFKTPTYTPKVVDSWTYAEMYRTSELNSGVSEDGLRFSEEDVANYRSGTDLDRYPNTNWFDEVIDDKALFTKHNLLFSGGGDKTKYAFGLGYLRNETYTPGEATDRYNFSSKTTSELKPWLTVTSNVNFIYKNYDREKGPAALTEFLRVPPTQVAKHTNGEWGSIRDNSEASAGQINANPLRTLEESGRANSDTKHFLGTMLAEITPMEGLKISNQIGYRYWDYRGFSFQNKKEGVPSFLNPSSGLIPGTASDVNQMNMNWQYSEKLIYDGWVNYEKTLNEVHNVSAMAGIHADTYTFKNLKVGRKDFASNEMNAFNGGSTDPDKQLTTEGSVQESSTLSYFGRLTYNYNQKYLFEANLRADASSRFAKQGRWGYFPSFSAGWRMDQEAFLADVDWLSSLKLRASWGQNGNINNVGLYDTYSTYVSSGTALVNGNVVPTLVEGRIGNPNLTWETATTTNFGLDANIGNGLLGVSMDIYNRITDDILIRPNDVYAETGLDSSKVPARNVGSVRNRGIELALTHRKEIGDFSYQFGFNLAYNKNKILDLGNKVDQLPPSGYFVLEKGESVGSFYMYEADGLYSTDDVESGKVIPYGTQVPEAGMVKFVDQNEDGVINAEDRTIVAKDVPDFTYGLNLELNYKDLSLSITGQGVSGVKMYMDNEASQAFFNNSVPRDWQKNNWTESNQNAKYPKLFRETDDRYKYNSITSSYWLFDATYFRIKNISLSYNISKNLTQRVGLNKVRVYVSADNPFTIRGDHRMKDFDPERSSGRGAQLGVKTFTSGVSVTF